MPKPKRKPHLLRADAALLAAVRRIAEREGRSLNAEIVYTLQRAVVERGDGDLSVSVGSVCRRRRGADEQKTDAAEPVSVLAPVIGFAASAVSRYCAACGGGPVKHEHELAVLVEAGGTRPLCATCAQRIAPSLVQVWDRWYSAEQRR